MKNSKTFWTNYNKSLRNKKAFTLIELIISIAIIALLATATFVAVDPAQRFGDAKDAIRASDAVAIEKGVQKAIAEGASVPVAMAALTEDTPYMMVTEGSATSGTCNCNTLDQSIARIDLAGDFKAYVAGDLPIDEEATGDDSGYYIKRKGNSFYVEPCNAYGDEYVAADPVTVTCYFDDYDSGGEEWLDPGYMVDNNTSAYAYQSFGMEGTVQRLTHSTCASETFGTISQVRIRHYGHCMFEDCGNTLRPVFGGAIDGDNHLEDVSVGSGWRSWYDITNDTNAPGTWTTSDVVNLDLDVEATLIAGASNKQWMVYKVELEVTHTP